MTAPAYTFQGITLCAPCAYLPTVLGLIVTGLGKPDSMEDAIARMALAQVEAGNEIDTPVAVNGPGICEGCGQAFGPTPAEAAEEVA